MHTLTQTGHMDRMAAFVVETVSVQDIRQFQVCTACLLFSHMHLPLNTHVYTPSYSSSFLLQVNSLPSMALYNRREGKWRGESGAEGTVIDYINFATQGKLQDGM